MSAKYFMSSEIDNGRPESSLFHVISAPFEATVSYGGGTANGPPAIIEASDQLELWDGASIPAKQGIHTAPALDCGLGGDEGGGRAEAVLERIEQAVDRALDQGAVPALLGGEHTVTLGALRAFRKRFGEFGVVQFDAHADLRDEYEGLKLSHACVMHRALDMDIPIFQLGVRALSQAEAELRQERNIPYLDGRALALRPLPNLFLPMEFPRDIYVTFDVDGLDPSVIRATGTPVPGGIGWHQAMQLLERAAMGRRIIGFDVVELAPEPGDRASDFAAAQLVYNIMGIAARARMKHA